MRKLGTLLFGLLLIVFTATAPLVAQSPAALKPVAQTKTEAKEEHPHIESAIKALENAKHQLESAAHDFNGHRAKALQHVNEALEECHAALMSDKK